MTAALLSIALVLTPAPLQAPKETPTWPPTSSVLIAEPSKSNVTPFSLPDIETLFVSVEIASPAPPEPPPPDPVPLTLRERALSRLAELGAPQWVVDAFDCVGWYESKWQNVRSRTGDTGWAQINDVHLPELRRLGLDPWVPEDAATFSWLLFTRAGWSFRDWTVRGLCGLR